MKRFSYFWIALGMALLILLPIHSMAQTPLKMRLMTKSGDMITTNEPRIKTFFFSDGDGTLSIILEDSLNFDDTHTLISIGNPKNCSLSGNGGVEARAGGGEFSFDVSSPNANISAPILPSGGFNIASGYFNLGKFSWIPTSEDVGTHFAVFEAKDQANVLKKTQIVVMIKIVTSATDTQPPVVSITSPANNHNTSSSPITLSGTASDNVGVTSVTWSNSRGGSGTANGTSPWSASIPLQEGSNNITVTARDAAGNAGSSSININYNTTNLTGKWANQVASATKLNTLLSGYASAYGVSGIGINKFEKKYFLVDPKAFDIPFFGSGWTHVEVRDLRQGTYINIYYPKVYKINPNADELAWWAMNGAGDFGIDVAFLKTDYDNGIRFLVELEEKGLGSTVDHLTVFWAYR